MLFEPVGFIRRDHAHSDLGVGDGRDAVVHNFRSEIQIASLHRALFSLASCRSFDVGRDAISRPRI